MRTAWYERTTNLSPSRIPVVVSTAAIILLIFRFSVPLNQKSTQQYGIDTIIASCMTVLYDSNVQFGRTVH